VQTVFSELDPANAAIYDSNAAAYLAELTDLESYAETQLAQISAENRFLVTNHDSLSYFAHTYNFTVLGTVIPGSSTLAEPSASDLTALIATMAEHNLCTIFTEVTVSDSLAKTAAGELTNCDEVQVLPLYTGAIGPSGSGADSYIGMFRANVDAVVAGLKG
jgi:ABC-type Zn uptake system ZnuABC Zn-binding protein ZnuA